MNKARLEAFTDGVLAIIITIMVLELEVPNGEDISALFPLWTVLLTYILSFGYIGIYWTNHHHLFQVVSHSTSSVLMANLNLLFWLSLIPFTTGWMEETHFSRWPVVLYGLNLLAAALSYYALQTRVIAVHGHSSSLAVALKGDRKNEISLLSLVLGVLLALIGSPILGFLIFCAVALVWLIPDKRLEALVRQQRQREIQSLHGDGNES